ncbi:ATP-dependent helicase HrpB [Psychrobium sp. 1_MG-2023]|uniref:ATP-dependent helicase HrpB n=1 Tax=Psychrobium sp. 1_MG-2023 TaxID=3062624 RepID=UPI000C32B67E|nr:ATP-dependent helicase HrpB [Psychrobium sp. 1_MG-2023]MDP2562131.1 ATP-dependent helicase HrpB [Psychrobium sp. 1_MG-2023]PKF57192.1 ATP-dependent helicase HrpB [Alteromonadales bacterium alter-6D02]
MQKLPISDVLETLHQAINNTAQVILQAPPGAGKSTFLPLQLLLKAEQLHPNFAGKKILMLEPRRLAARNIARYIASQLNEPVGKTVGYRVRGEHKVSNDTRLEIITEGILTRMIQQDPELSDVALVIFDEYHERSIHADTALALCLEIQDALRDDLCLLVMSATLNSEQLTQLLPEAQVITSQGRCYPVDIYYRPRNPKLPLPGQVSGLIEQALQDYDGNILVFLPGASEINKVASQLNHLPANTHVCPLYGQLKQQAQDQAIAPTTNGERKVVLATNIAETSLTIEGISLVIDSGLVNMASFNRNNGVTKLSKEPISQASSEQRAGRAGRVQAGHCWRMWPQEQQSRLAKFDQPEIERSDLLPLALELAKWGVQDVNQLAWLNPPPAHNLQQARDLLIEYDAMDSHGQLTRHGEAMYQFGSNPRLGHMMLWAKEHDSALCATATLLSAMLEQTNALTKEIDIENQLNFLAHQRSLNASQQQIINQAKKYCQNLGVSYGQFDSGECGLLLAQAYPDRIAKQRANSDKYQMANGYGVNLPEGYHAKHPYIVVADLMSFSGNRQASSQNEGRIFLAAPVDIEQLEQRSPEHFKSQQLLQWDDRSDKVIALTQLKLRQLIIKEQPLSKPDLSMLNQALSDGLRAKGLSYLNLSKTETQLLQRLQFAHNNEPELWPDYSEAALLHELSEWLEPFYDGAKKLTALKQINLSDALLSRLDWPQQQQLAQLYPTHLTVASGSNIRLDYSDGEQVKLSVRIQELFGTMVNPSVGRNQLPVLVEMLSPAQRPIQLTKDLVSFWHGSYDEVKKDMKGRYPKLQWGIQH